jgi:hypothetical protein
MNTRGEFLTVETVKYLQKQHNSLYNKLLMIIMCRNIMISVDQE